MYETWGLYRQADEVVRHMAWLTRFGWSGFSYFEPEGSCAYGNPDSLDFSLITDPNADTRNFVRPAALALMVYKTQVGSRAYDGPASIAMPNAYGSRYGNANGASDQALMVWTADMAATMNLTLSPAAGQNPPANVSVVVTDELGRATTKSLASSGGTAVLPVSGSPSYIVAPSSVTLALAPSESYGDNVALGAPVAASSSANGNPATNLTDGVISHENSAGPSGVSLWSNTENDPQPTVTVTLAQPTMIDRIVLYLHSLGSVLTTARDYDVSVEVGGQWQTVAKVRKNLWNRVDQLSFAPVLASAIQVHVLDVNYGGDAAGAPPPYWGKSNGKPDFAPAYLWEIEAYAPGQ
jgi:hypothetical protein